MRRTLSLLVITGTTMVLSSCDRLGVDRVDGRGATPLMVAANRGDSLEVARLIAAGADVNATVLRADVRALIAIARNQEVVQAPPEWTPLLFATRDTMSSTARLAVIRLLIANGADVRHETRASESALRFAIRRNNNAEMARLLIAAGARADEKLFLWAVTKGKPEIVQLLLSGGADSSARAAADARPFAPVLIDAVKRGDSTVVKLLVDAGFKVNPRDRNGWTALGWARAAEAKGASPAAGAMLRLLRAAGARDDGGVQALALFDAIEKKDLASVKTALKAGANPNARDNSSVPLLVRAADLGQADIVSALIEAGAHLNVTPQFGASPLTAAIQNGSVETVKRLLAAGARSDQRDSKGQTPLMVSTIWSRKEIVSLLLADSVKVEPQALSMAAYKGDTSQLRMMLDHGGDPNSGRALIGAVRGCRARDNTPAIRMLLLRGARPQGNADYGLLHRAASSCPAEVLELLLQQGAELNGRDFFGATALMAAAKAGKISSVRVLIAAGADVHARNEDGMNAISLTRSSEVRQELLKAGARYLAERE